MDRVDGFDFDFARLVDHPDVCLCVIQDGRFVHVNASFARMLGAAPRRFIGAQVLSFVHPNDRTRVREALCLQDATPRACKLEARLHGRDGKRFEATLRGHAVIHRGRQAHVVAMSELDELAAARHSSRRQARLLDRTQALCDSGFIEIDVARRTVRLSAGACRLVMIEGAGCELSFGQALRCVMPADRTRLLAQWRSACLETDFESAYRLIRADGSTLHVLQRGYLEPGMGRDVGRPVAVLRDVTDQRLAQQRIEQLQDLHPVTGLASRAALHRRAALAEDTARTTQLPLAMLVLRVPALDRIHDALGFTAGHSMMSILAERISSQCRAGDTVAQLERGEFAVLLDPASGADRSDASAIAHRVLAALESPTKIGSTEYFPGGRIGVAMFPDDANDASKLLECAHKASNNVEEKISFFTRTSGDPAIRRIKLETALVRAIEREEFTLHYQPQVDLANGRVVGAEALLRWHHRDFGAVSPAEFVPIAEEIGLIVALGDWVFRAACVQSVAWKKIGLTPIRIGVNFSPLQLRESDLVPRIEAILNSTGADPRALGVEVTESIVTHDFALAQRTLTAFSTLGMEISLDDFGTGYSNLSTLRSLRFDVLKIDRSLIHDITLGPDDVSLTRAVLMLARGLRIKVLAEGVETEQQVRQLMNAGCDLMQGYVFSKPLPVAQFEALLRAGRRLSAFGRPSGKERAAEPAVPPMRLETGSEPTGDALSARSGAAP
ncbi:MAG: EAL domain-containing protein [Caldimonas sp.]